MGETFISNLRSIQQGQINGILNFINYDNYTSFVNFIESSESLRIGYKIPYSDGSNREYFKDIHDYLKNQKDVDKKLLDKADSIERFLSEIQRKYESIFKEK